MDQSDPGCFLSVEESIKAISIEAKRLVLFLEELSSSEKDLYLVTLERQTRAWLSEFA